MPQWIAGRRRWVVGFVAGLVMVVLAVPQVAEASVRSDLIKARVKAQQERTRVEVAARLAHSDNARVDLLKTPPTPDPTPVATPRRISAPAAPEGAIQPSGDIPSRVAAAWPGDDRWALRVTRCETGGYVDFYNESSGAEGVWQFMPSTWKGLGETGSPNQYSVEHQTAAAWRLYNRSGASQWDCN